MQNEIKDNQAEKSSNQSGKKGNQTTLIIILAIVILLSGACIAYGKMFASNISYEKSSEEDNETEDGNLDDTTSSDNYEETTEITEEEALEVAKTALNVAINFFDYPNVYCGTSTSISDIEWVNSEGLSTGNYYYISNEYNTKDELNQYLLNYMTEDIINTKTTYADTTNNYYLEQDGHLYCANLGKGGEDAYNETYSTYTINNFSTTEINLTVEAAYTYSSSDDTSISRNKTISVTLSNNNDVWQISTYDVVSE